MFSILFLSTPTKADELRDFGEFVNNYGLMGQRICGHWSDYNESIGVVSGEYKVCAFEYNNCVMMFTTDSSCLSFRGPFDQFPNNTGYYAGWTRLQSMDLRLANSYWDGVNLSSVFSLGETPVYFCADGLHNWTLIENSCDVRFTNLQDFLDEMEENGWKNPNDPNNPNNGKLPLLKMTVKREIVPNFGIPLQKNKEIFEWNYADEILYSNNPTSYYLEIIASAHITPPLNGIGKPTVDTQDPTINDNCKVTISSSIPISKNSYSFIYEDIGKALYNAGGYNSFNELAGYFVYIRIVGKENDETSNWKMYQFAMNGEKRQEGYIIDPDTGQAHSITPDDDTDTGPAKYTNDSNADTKSDPSSISYEGSDGTYNVGTMVGTLKSIINELRDFPLLVAQIFGIFPDWMINLIIVSIGLLVVIGLVKTILN